MFQKLLAESSRGPIDLTGSLSRFRVEAARGYRYGCGMNSPGLDQDHNWVNMVLTETYSPHRSKNTLICIKFRNKSMLTEFGVGNRVGSFVYLR